jgi:hypothetical protein
MNIPKWKAIFAEIGVFGKHEINQGCGKIKLLWKIIFSCTIKKPLRGQMFAGPMELHLHAW